MPTFAINRSKLLEGILKREGWECVIDINEPCVGLSMWDSLSKPGIPGPTDCKLRCLRKDESSSIDNKKHLWTHLRDSIRKSLPETIFGDINPPVFDKSGIWFLKKGHTSGGKDIHCGSYQEIQTILQSVDNKKQWVIQRGVNSCLINGKKWTLRSYVLYHPNRSVWLFEEGIAIIHKVEFDPDSTEREIHVDHIGCTRIAFSSLSMFDDVLPKLKNLVADIFKAYQPFLNKDSDPSRYHLFGLDFIITEDLLPILIEVNMFPNMSSSSRNVAKQIKLNVFESMYSLLIAPLIEGKEPESDGFVCVLGPYNSSQE